MTDFSLNQSFAPGDRVELHPATDLWMRGVKFATVIKTDTRDMVHVRLDLQRPRNLVVKFNKLNLKLVKP